MTKTPGQSDEDRALAEIARRRDRAEDARPAVDAGDITSPHQLIDLERYQNDEQYKHDWDAAMDAFQKNAAYRVLWMESRRSRRDSEGSARAEANAALHTTAGVAKVDQFADELKRVDTELKSVTTVLKVTKWILGFVIAAVLGGIITIATKIFDWGMTTGESETRIQTLEKEVNSLDKRLESLLNGKAQHP